MKGKRKQDKESATGSLESPERALAEAGNPLCPDGEETVKDKRARRYIRITDVECWRLIDEISKDERYGSFNKIITDALFYGLPLLYENVFGQEVSLTEEAPPSERAINRLEDRHFQTMIRLLKEVVLNVTINKSILSALFHGKKLEYRGCKVDNNSFENGLFSDTPDYLYDYETEGLKKMRR